MKIIITEQQFENIVKIITEDEEPSVFGVPIPKQLQILGKAFDKPMETFIKSLLSNLTPEQGEKLKEYLKNVSNYDNLRKSYNSHISKNTTKIGNKIVDYFVNKGFTPQQAAGIAGNLYQESTLNPTIVGDNGTAYGLAQWRGSRLRDLKNSIPNWKTVDGQLDFIWKELNSTESKTLGLLKRARTPEEAAIIFSKHYERPGIPHNDRRMGYAQNMFTNYSNYMA